MNNFNVSDSGFLQKASALLNNKAFSDVEIQVINDGTNARSFAAHKLFLAMNSEYFANYFYGSSAPCKIFKIFDFKPKIVFMMLEFLYTNKVNISETIEARELYSLSKKYGIRDLQELCVDHISRNEVNSDNVLYMYDIALRDRYLKCLDICRKVVSSNTKAVFESQCFVETPYLVLEDILQQDTLKVDRELDILKAVIMWAFHECKRRNLNDLCSLRECILPLFINIRILNLSYEEFCDIVEKYPIFNAHESSLITKKLLQPNESIRLPPYICQIRSPRVYSKNTRELEYDNLNPSSSTQQISKCSGLPHFKNRKLKSSPVSKVYPQLNVSALKTFDFSLQKAEKLLSTAFENDVKCSVTINLLKRMVIFHGVELRIEQSNETAELINVILDVSSSEANLHVSSTFTEELKDSAFTLMFKQPVKMHQSNHAKIQVTIEDLKLNRCSILNDPVSKLEHCSDTVAELELTSNHVNDKGKHFFLISRLIYSLI